MSFKLRKDEDESCPDTYSRTFKYAAQAHHGQQVTGTELPYITHISLVNVEVMAAL